MKKPGMNIKELNAALIVMGGALTTLFGETIMVNKHVVTIQANGNIAVDHQPIAKVSHLDTIEDKWNLVQNIVRITQ